VLVWIREILQGGGQWEADARPDDNARWTPTGARSGTKLGTFLGAHVASRIYLEIESTAKRQSYPQAILTAYDKRGMNMQTEKGFDDEPSETLNDIAKSVGRQSFHLDMWDHSVGIHFCGPGAATYYFDPNYGVYRYATIAGFKEHVNLHLVARKYCDPEAKDPRRNEVACAPIVLKG